MFLRTLQKNLFEIKYQISNVREIQIVDDNIVPSWWLDLFVLFSKKSKSDINFDFQGYKQN